MPNLFSVCGGGPIGDASSGFTGNTFSTCTSKGDLYPYRTDGYYDGSLMFRGVRAYDSDTQQWSTPDAFGGYPADPISSLAYNYAANNPAIFADPSGFDSTNPDCGARTTIDCMTIGGCDWICQLNLGSMMNMIAAMYGQLPGGVTRGGSLGWGISVSSPNCADPGGLSVTVTSPFGSHSYSITKSVFSKALAVAGAKGGQATMLFLANRAVPALGGALGTLVPFADVTGFSEFAGTAAFAVLARPLAGKAAQAIGAGIGGGAGKVAADIAWDALEAEGRKRCSK